MRMKEGSPAKTIVYLCEGVSCSERSLKPWTEIRTECEDMPNVEIRPTNCLSRCATAPNLCVTGEDPTVSTPVYIGSVGKRLFGTPVGKALERIRLYDSLLK